MRWATSRGRCGVAQTVTSRLGGVALPLYTGLCGECGPVRKRVVHSFAGSAGHPGRLRRNREESTAGDMWRPVRTLSPHALDLGSDSALRIPALRSISVPGGSGPNPGPGPAHRPQSFRELSDPRFPFLPQSLWEVSASFNLTPGSSLPVSFLNASLKSSTGSCSVLYF